MDITTARTTDAQSLFIEGRLPILEDANVPPPCRELEERTESLRRRLDRYDVSIAVFIVPEVLVPPFNLRQARDVVVDQRVVDASHAHVHPSEGHVRRHER